MAQTDKISHSDSGGEENFEALPDLGQRLGINPNSFRAILEKYSDYLPLQERGGEKGLSGRAIDHLEQIHKKTVQGYTEEEIRQHLAASREDPSVDSDLNEDLLDSGDLCGKDRDEILAELEKLQEQLRESERERIKERDKLMMLLMRTQKEIKQLRHDIAKVKGRSHKRSLIDRIFGR